MVWKQRQDLSLLALLLVQEPPGRPCSSPAPVPTSWHSPSVGNGDKPRLCSCLCSCSCSAPRQSKQYRQLSVRARPPAAAHPIHHALPSHRCAFELHHRFSSSTKNISNKNSVLADWKLWK